MRFTAWWMGWLPVLLVACVSRPPAPPPSAGIVVHVPKLSIVPETLVFPYGRYRHQIHVKIPDDGRGQAREFSFSAVVVTSAQAVDVVGLSPFNTTLMKLHEDRQSGEVRGEAFDDRIREHQDDLGRFYPVLRALLLLSRDSASGDSQLKVTEKTADGEPRTLSYRGRVDVQLSDYQNRVPRQIRITQTHFQAQVQVEPL